MKLKKVRRKDAMRILLTLIMLLSCFGALHGSAQNALASEAETDMLCSLTLELPGAFEEALWSEEVAVRLYRIAEYASDGTWQDLTGYEETLQLAAIDSDTKAEVLVDTAEKAAELLGVAAWEENPQRMPDQELLIINASGTASGIPSGMYLLCVKPVTVGTTTYSALPYLISLPTQMTKTNAGGNESLVWVSDVTVEIKMKETTEEEPVTEEPTEELTEAPTEVPTEAPTEVPTEAQTEEPTEVQTQKPTEAQTEESTEAPTEESTETPAAASPQTGDASHPYIYLILMISAAAILVMGSIRKLRQQ